MRSKFFNQRGILTILYMKLTFEYHSAGKKSLKNNPTDVMVMSLGLLGWSLRSSCISSRVTGQAVQAVEGRVCCLLMVRSVV